MLMRRRISRRPRSQHAWAISFTGDILAFLIGLGSCYTFHLTGDIPLCEVILIPTLLLLFAIRSSRLRLRKTPLGTILLLMLLWLLGQIVTDIYRSTSSHDWLRGNANIVFFMLDLVGMIMLLKGNMRRQIIILLGFACGGILSVKLQPSLFPGKMAFKFGYAFPVMYFTAIISSYFYKRHRYFVVSLLFLANIAVNTLLNLRSLTLTMLIAFALIVPIIPEWIGRIRILPPAHTRARVLAVMGITLVAGVLAGKLMTSLAASGLLGPDAQQKNKAETVAGWGVLIGGRPEILVSSRAVFDSPILGHGSWAKDPKYSEMLANIEAEYGMPIPDEGENSEGLIPAHSHLMSAWVDAGILGAVFWIYYFVLVLKALLRSGMGDSPLKPVHIFLMTMSLWEILFSPFGGVQRIVESVYIVIICDALEQSSHMQNIVTRAVSRTVSTIQRRQHIASA